MEYVDLNSIRAGIAETPEASEFTSIHQRIREFKRELEAPKHDGVKPPLMRIQVLAEHGSRGALPFSLPDYIELVDWTGRVQREDKPGRVDPRLPTVMQSLNLDPEVWSNAMRPQGNVFGRAMGQLDRLRLHAASLDQSWIRGMHQARRLYG
jgi:hypothetical protein